MSGRPNFTFRMSDAVRRRIELAAALNQRSLSEEVERLEQSFADGTPGLHPLREERPLPREPFGSNGGCALGVTLLVAAAVMLALVAIFAGGR